MTKHSKTILLALLLRIIIMPFFAHMDFYNSLSRTAKLINGNTAYFSYETILFSIGLLLGYKFILPFLTFLKLNPWNYTVVSLKQITSLKSIFFVNFFGKLPFLFLDCGIIYLLFALFKKNKHFNKILFIYLFNPVILYVVYFIGRYELYQFLFILWGFYCLKHEKYPLSFFLFGWAVHIRLYPILLFPFLFFFIKKPFKSKLYYTFFFIIPIAIKKIIVYSLPDKKDAFFQSIAPTSISQTLNPLGTIFKSGHIYFILNPTLFGVPLILLFSAIVFLFFLKLKEKKITTLINFISLIFLILYGFGSLEPQYYCWGIPFIIFSFFSINKSYLFWSLYFVLNASMFIDFDKSSTTYLALPINTYFFYSLPSIKKIIILTIGEYGLKTYQFLFRFLCLYLFLKIFIKHYSLNSIKKILIKIEIYFNKLLRIKKYVFIVFILMFSILLYKFNIKKIIIMPYYPFIENYNTVIRLSKYNTNKIKFSFFANKKNLNGFLLYIRAHNELCNFYIKDGNKILAKTISKINFKQKIKRIYFSNKIKLKKKKKYYFVIESIKPKSTVIIGWNNTKKFVFGNITFPKMTGYPYFKPLYWIFDL